MIADWTVDVGPGSPSIDVPWEGWVDLRWDARDSTRPWHARAVRELPEVRAFPELIYMLKMLNGGCYFTSKVDVFPITRDEVDPEIAEAGHVVTRRGVGSYFDLLADTAGLFWTFDQYESLARGMVSTFGRMELLMPASAEVVIRPARIFGRPTFGWTVYVMGFGPDAAAARQTWRAAAKEFAGQLRTFGLANI